jgi:acyl phosphate:glycerol-3-phosphate acyltransferase
VFILELVLVAVIGYLLGSVNASIVVGKFYGVDVRNHGSGNAGATNTLRTLGKKAAIFAGLGDVLKGVLACLIGLYLIGEVKDIGNLGLMLGGISAIIGHNWPIYFGFKGGKGIFTSFAVVLMMDWRIGLLLFGLFLIVVAFSKFISLGSILASGLFPIVSAIPIFKKSYIFIIFAVVLGMLAIFRHRSNIVRIINGTESKFGAKKKTGDSH